MRSAARTTAAILAAAAAVVVLQPATQAEAYWACGETRPRNLDASAFVVTNYSFQIRRGSSDECGIIDTVERDMWLGHYCYTLGPDDARWTYLNAYTQVNGAGWARNTMLPNNGSKVYFGK